MADSNYNLNINIPVSSPQLDDAIKKLERMEKLRKSLEKQVDLVPDSAIKELTDLLKITEKNTTAIKRQKQAIDERTKVSNQLTQSRTAEAKQIAGLREQLRLQNKANREEAKSKLETLSAYERLSKTLLKNQKRVKDLLAENRKLTSQERQLIKETQRLDSQIKKIDKTVGQSRRNVGNYSSAFGRLGGSLRNVAQAAGVTLGVFGAFRIIKDSITIVRTFEKQNAVLAGVLNTTRSEITDLTDDAIRLGSITAKTATEVTGLQIAYSRLGFTQEQIIALTEPTINGSIALNAGLAETANLVGAVVNTFDDFSALDAPEILDVLVTSTQRSALEFSKLEAALPVVGGAANAAGIPFNKLVALLGKLSDSGIDASSSATALRNIFIESASQGLDFTQILDKIKNSQDKLTVANDEFGKRAAVSASVLANNIDAVDELEEALDNAGGTAERVAEEQLNTLDGAIALLRSAWEGFILDLNDGGAVISGPLTSAIRFLSANLRTIIKVLGIAIGAFLAYKASIIAINIVKSTFTATTRIASVVQEIFTGKIKLGTIAMRSFNKVTKANIFGALATVAIAAATAMGLFGDEVEEASEAQKELNNQIKEAQEILARQVSIQKQIELIETLNKRQVEVLRNRIKEEIQLEEDRIVTFISANQGLFVELNRAERANDEKKRKSFEQVLRRQLGNELNLRDSVNRLRIATEQELTDFLAGQTIDRLKGFDAIAQKRLESIGNIDDEVGSLGSLIEAQKVLLKQAKELPETTEAQLIVKNRLIQAINKEIKRLRALGIEKGKEDEAQKIRDKRLIDRIRREEKAQREVIKTAGEIGKTLEIIENERFKNEIKRIGLENNDLQNLTEQQNDALDALADIHAENLLKIRRDKIAKEKIIDEKAAAERKAREEEEFQRAVSQIDFIAQKIGEAQQARSDDELERISKEISAQDRQLEEQLRRAERGLENTLELQQERAAKLEIERQEEQERQERRQKILAFYNLLSGYAKENPNTALSRAAKDIALGEAISLAFGEKGGVIGDINTSTTLKNGDLSRKHKSGDRLIVASPKEGLINESQMDKLGGKRGFYDLTKAIDNDMMFPQVPVFKEVSSTGTGEITQRLENIEQAIIRKPVSSTKLDELGNVITRRQEEGVAHIKKIISSKPSFRR